MIEHAPLPDGGIQIIQHMMRPGVYLDHWAWRIFADDRSLGDRLVKAIEMRTGTVALAWLNVLEFLQVEPTQQNSSSLLVERLYPRIVFLRLDPFEIQALERDRNFSGDAHLDAEYSKALVNAWSSDRRPLSIKKIFSNDSQEMEAMKRDLSGVIVGRVRTMRRQLRTDRKFNADLRRELRLDPKLSKAILVQREYLRALLIDPARNFSQNDAIDMLHTVVPLAYCDYALLDRAGVDHWQRLQRRIKTSRHEMKIARVYSQSQIDEFLSDLENPSGPTIEPIIYRSVIPRSLIELTGLK